MDGKQSSRGVGRPGIVALAGLFAFTLAAVGGYGYYGLHPERLPESEFALTFFTISFEFFARLHIVVAALALLVVLVRALGARWVAPFAVVYALSFSAEHMGTGYGIPFGGYSYTGLLGWKLGGRVPFLIPVSWFLMAVPAWVIARRAFRDQHEAVGRVLFGALWLVLWDLALDPAMSYLTPYWLWEETGPYYGMPWINLLGWYVTGLALLTALELFSRRVDWSVLDMRWMVGYYLAMVLMPLGMLAAAGLWLGVLVTVFALAAVGWLTVWLGDRERSSQSVDAWPVGVEA